MTVGRLLEEISARELAEWQAYLGRDAEITALISKGTDPDLAHQMVWGTQDDEADETD